MRSTRRHLQALRLAALALLLAACTGPSQSTDGGNPFVSLGAEEAYEEGVAAHREARYDDSEAAFRQAIQVNPRYLAAYLGLGRTLNDDERPSEALSVYDQAVGIRERTGEAHWGRANALLKLDRLDEAVEAANTAISYGYEDDAIVVLALAYERQGDVRNAIAMLEEIIRTNPGRTELRIQLSRMYLGQGRARDAVPLLERAAFADTANLEAWTALAELYYQLEVWDRAIEAWQHVGRMTPSDPIPLVRQAESQLMTGNHMVAIQVLGDAIQLDARLAEAYVLRGRAQVEGGFLDRALADANRALQMDPQNLAALDLIAEIHTLRNSTANAIAAYEALIAADPTALQPAVALARLHLGNDDPAAALRVLEPFSDNAGDNPALTETLFAGHQRLGNEDEALSYLLDYVSTRSTDPVLLLEVVETALAMEQQTRLSSAEVLEYAEQALRLSGGFRTEYRLAYIDALVADGQHDMALAVTLRALEDLPNNPDLRERRRQLE